MSERRRRSVAHGSRGILFLLALQLSSQILADTPSPKPRLLLMDLRAQGVDENTARTIQDLMALELARSRRYDVISGEELRTFLNMKADRQLLGCAEDSCLAEIAGAFGASLVVFGSVGKLGEMFVVNISLFDAAQVRAVRRVDVRVRRLEDMLPALPPKLAELLAEPALAQGPGRATPASKDPPPATASSPAASSPSAGDEGPSLTWPLALVSVGSAGLVSGVVLGAIGYAVAYRPLEERSGEIQDLEQQGPSTRTAAQSAQSDLSELSNATLLWSGAALGTALAGAGLLTTGLLLWPGQEEEEAAQ